MDPTYLEMSGWQCEFPLGTTRECMLRVRVHYELAAASGLSLAVYGSSPELGQWNPRRCVRGVQTTPGWWTFNKIIWSPYHEFRFIVIDKQMNIIVEEKCDVHRLDLQGLGDSRDINIDHVWGTTYTLLPPPVQEKSQDSTNDYMKRECKLSASVHYQVASGSGLSVALIGSSPELGEWNVLRCIKARPLANDRWSIDIILWSDYHEFKFVLIDAHKKVVRWEECSNHQVHLRALSGTRDITLNHIWGQTFKLLPTRATPVAPSTAPVPMSVSAPVNMIVSDHTHLVKENKNTNSFTEDACTSSDEDTRYVCHADITTEGVVGDFDEDMTKSTGDLAKDGTRDTSEVEVTLTDCLLDFPPEGVIGATVIGSNLEAGLSDLTCSGKVNDGLPVVPSHESLATKPKKNKKFRSLRKSFSRFCRAVRSVF